MKHLKVILLTLVVFSCNTSKETEEEITSEVDSFKELTTLVDMYANDILEKNHVNSFALAIYKDGKMYQNYYGVIDKTLGNKPNDSSLYEIASITKTFTGSLVAKAVLEGKISLDDDIRKYLAGDYSNLEYEGHPITIKNLLTHSIGLKVKTPPQLKTFNEKMNSGLHTEDIEVYSIQDLLEELKSAEVDKKPGTVFAYNSVGPELLAYILEQVNETPFKEQLNVFLKEIGMHNTYLQESEKYKSKLVRGYKADTLAQVDYCPIYGAAGGAISSLPDLSTYMKYLVDHKNEPWIKEASKSLFVDKEDDENIGYLWQNIGTSEEEGYYYSKTGTSNGTQSGVLICPDSNYGMVLIANNTSDEAFNDWATLFFRDIEPDLIKYPRLNLFSKYKEAILKGSEEAIVEYNKLKTDTANYYTPNANKFNNYGYDYLAANQHKEAISTFKFAINQFPNETNLYDSLGEAHFINKEYELALKYFKKVLELNPKSENARSYIDKVEKYIKENT